MVGDIAVNLFAIVGVGILPGLRPLLLWLEKLHAMGESNNGTDETALLIEQWDQSFRAAHVDPVIFAERFGQGAFFYMNAPHKRAEDRQHQK